MYQNSFLNSAIQQFQMYDALGSKAILQCSDMDINCLLHPDTNSITTIVRHMHGNMKSRWTDFLTTDGEKPWRNRDGEFQPEITSQKEALKLWDEGWQIVYEAMHTCAEVPLNYTIRIRSQPLTVMDAILRQLTHYAYHVGQIVYLAHIARGFDWNNLSIPRGESHQFNSDMNHNFTQEKP